MAFNEGLAERVRAAVCGRTGVAEKKMFGGVAFLLRGKMFCGIVGDDLMVRVGPERYEECLALAHVRPMDFTGKPMKGYVFVRPAGCRTAMSLQRWVDRGLDFVSGMGTRTTAKARRTTSARKPEAAAITFVEVFERLKQLVRAHAGSLDVQIDTESEYVLTGPMMPRWKKELWFGGVRMGKAYVSLHLMPVYMFPDLLRGLSPKLRASMQGKSCFNFKRIEPELLSEVDALVAASIERLRAEGILAARRKGGR